MNREGLSSRSLTVGPGFITMFKAKYLTLCLSTRELIKESCAAKIWILKHVQVTMYSKIQLFEVQPCADPESYVRGGPTLTFFS